MKLHSLTIQGFGPFKDKQEIDFDALSQDRIFMLEGPTGAGKSSIIDAIVYALYGVTAHEAATKAGPAGQRVRSDYCEAGDETKVVLEFTTGGARYKISRTAAYDAPKKSGEGTTPVNAKAVLEFINPAHEAIHQVREVNLRIKEELRLDNEQFSQMVVLPQGDFASFLHASTEKRREVLESIFKTFFYDKIKGEIDARAKEILTLLARENQNLSHHLRNLSDEVTEESPEIDFKALEDIVADKNVQRAEQDQAIAEAVTALRPKSDQQLAKKDSLEKELAPLSADLIKLQESHQQIERKRTLSEELITLNSRSDEFIEKEAHLRARQKASGLQEIINSRDDAADAMQKALDQIDEEYVELTAAQVNARIKKLNTEVPALARKSDAASKAADEVETLTSSIKESLEYEAQIKALPGLITKVAASEKKVAAAKKKLKDYRTLEMDSVIFEAAKKLKKGHQCPVCGSLDHPKPVKATHSFDPDQVALLEDQLEKLEGELSELRFEVKSGESASKKKFKPSAELEKKLATLKSDSKQADELAEKYEAAQLELDALNGSLPAFIAYENSEKSHGAAETKLTAEMKRLKIEDEDALAELLEIDEEALHSEIDTYKGRIKEITALLSQPEFKKLPEATDELEAKVATLVEKIGVIESALAAVNDQLAIVERVNESIDAARDGIHQALDAITALRTSGDPYLKLQGWVDGKNVAGLSLTNFVLQERLEMILEFASRHLRRMSNNKYEFRLHEEKQGRTKQAGLGITIMDFFAGKERPAETLSGGETFYASLALALGLVEVVKGDNGGIELGTLFIDEGFGSLSDDTLEEVLDVLEDLREERVIGIISHVEGMKTQIPMRLEVRPTDHGPSTVTMNVGRRD
jgi:exonuclease SbcC